MITSRQCWDVSEIKYKLIIALHLCIYLYLDETFRMHTILVYHANSDIIGFKIYPFAFWFIMQTGMLLVLKFTHLPIYTILVSFQTEKLLVLKCTHLPSLLLSLMYKLCCKNWYHQELHCKLDLAIEIKLSLD